MKLEAIVDYLSQHEITLATAESCTAGLIVSELARIPGSGACIDCGLAVYSPESKNHYLNVSFDTIEEFGLTSEEVAREMVTGAINRTLNSSNGDAAVANTGVAGPGAADDGTPQGRVCFAWAIRSNGAVAIFSETRDFEGDRNTVRSAAAYYTLERLMHYHAQQANGHENSK